MDTLKRNVSEHPYKGQPQSDDGDGFEVYQTDEGWWWSFSPVWSDSGPFKTEQQAITAGENFVDEKGNPYIT